MHVCMCPARTVPDPYSRLLQGFSLLGISAWPLLSQVARMRSTASRPKENNIHHFSLSNNCMRPLHPSQMPPALRSPNLACRSSKLTVAEPRGMARCCASWGLQPVM